MFEYTLDNHFRFGYQSAPWFQPRQSSQQKFLAVYGTPKNFHLNWRESNRLAAREIAHRMPHPIWIMLSGGTDSEACLRTFVEEEIPVRVATLRFKGGFNRHDIEYAFSYSRETGQKLEVFDLNIEDFWNGLELYYIVDPIRCVSPILAAHLWLANQLDGTPVMAQGEPHLKKKVTDNYIPGLSPYGNEPWYLIESERLCSLYSHFILTGKPAVPGFYQYLPEQTLSFLRNNPILGDLVQNKIEGKLGTRSSKNQMVRQFYPEMEERVKYTGFETLAELHDLKRMELAQRFPDSDAYFSISYENLLNQLVSKQLND